MWGCLPAHGLPTASCLVLLGMLGTGQQWSPWKPPGAISICAYSTLVPAVHVLRGRLQALGERRVNLRASVSAGICFEFDSHRN